MRDTLRFPVEKRGALRDDADNSIIEGYAKLARDWRRMGRMDILFSSCMFAMGLFIAAVVGSAAAKIDPWSGDLVKPVALLALVLIVCALVAFSAWWVIESVQFSRKCQKEARECEALGVKYRDEIRPLEPGR